jgi:hypothetical protein
MSDYCELRDRHLLREFIKAMNAYRVGNVEEALEILRRAFGGNGNVELRDTD